MAEMGVDLFCGNCKFWRRLKLGQAGGTCRANPPIPMLVGAKPSLIHPGHQEPLFSNMWPGVPDTEWCGRHELADTRMKQLDVSQLQLADPEGRA